MALYVTALAAGAMLSAVLAFALVCEVRSRRALESRLRRILSSSSVKTWADYSSLVFGQKEGVVAKTFTDETERQMFYDSPQYKEVSAIREK